MEKTSKTLGIQDLLEEVVKRGASDLHLTVGAMPTVRIDGSLVAIEGHNPLNEESIIELVHSILTEDQKELLNANREIDFSFALGEVARFRVNAYHQKGYLAAALRYIPTQIRTVEDLNLPAIVKSFTRLPQGFVLVTGPTGHGKSTTLAAIINEVNENDAKHIITIEDPIEYVFPHRRSLISQRELHLDTHSWQVALKSTLREDPDVVLIGEMRDYETMAAALTIAETGHLVFSTLHTNSASATINRIIDVFPEHQQVQIRAQLAMTLEGVISQRLIPAIEGGRYPATEILLANPAVRSLIREGKTHQLDNLILTSSDTGMLSLEHSLHNLITAGKITREQALSHTLRPEELIRLLGN
ncbi:type IV pili twitching motility protein PilT [candidate division WWE3 bacterium CG_4_9_14_3_um_filter_41_6]|uniref:Type IV pili twitching motility protein PilT n=1 Tax=candidate division WWE3 bacterium CG_4_10_14_0_2_um_filter_41_14 TaxID=1975072 RepID=A0A2M7TFT4_UNCKA|nr:MAG: type IV pili twitching motility protein PilT [candidate division WWE3 bacterium CG_4_10_14_0_2_um_filter_41_14]PJA39334.1 MAG: type IV pili twitching motility protein PilT [candidate division WWE3 bacterium CG_4_9_14_3_um_filter_41_6]